MDAYYRMNPLLIVTSDPDSVSVEYPLKYIKRRNRNTSLGALRWYGHEGFGPLGLVDIYSPIKSRYLSQGLEVISKYAVRLMQL